MALRTVRHRPLIVIAGGGVAAVEALLALRAMLGGTVAIELLAPERELAYRPLSVAEPFGRSEIKRFDLDRLVADQQATRVPSALACVDLDGRFALTVDGGEHAYDRLIVAVGARPVVAVAGATQFRGPGDTQALSALLTRIESGDVKRIAFVAPAGLGWPLPVYELALYTAGWARDLGIRDVEVHVISGEVRPLEAFGQSGSGVVEQILSDAGLTFHHGSARSFADSMLELEGDTSIALDAVVALPSLEGPRIAGLPHDDLGFLPIDRHCAVDGSRNVWAAGDATTFPIKQGGLSAQQADAAASAIAASLGAVSMAEPFVPVLRGRLLGAGPPRYLRQVEGAATVTSTPLWWPPGKIAGRYFAPYAAGLHDGSRMADRAAEEAADEVDTTDAVELMLEIAELEAERGDLTSAARFFDAAEDVAGPLPAARYAQRRRWS
jgi:sulfide:quinone oxidoreductase